jgi:Tfp pilus assembly protein PilX
MSARQRGVVLAITLLILLILIVAGVSGMSDSTIQLSLARNSYVKHESFQNAESTLLTGEKKWDQQLTKCLNDVARCTLEIEPPMIDSLENHDWSTISSGGTTNFGKYIIEYLGRRPVHGDNETLFRMYRLTALGESQDSTARTVLQSIFRKCVRVDGPVCDGAGEE